MRDAVWLGVRALTATPGRALSLALALGVALGLPALTWRAGARAEAALRARADATPVVVGAPGDTFDLVFAALHFRPGDTPLVPWSTVAALQAPGLALAPVHVVHRADGVPLVGTSPEYYEARSLRPAAGRLPAVLGEIAVGAAIAEARGLRPGHRLRSDVEALHDLAGEAPLSLEVTAVLARAGTPDDHAIFADVRTAWALDGSLHGHTAVTEDQALPGSTDAHTRASGAVLPEDPLEADTATFHLHGDVGAQPLTAVLVFPVDARAHDLLLDRATTLPGLRAVRPGPVVAELLSIGHRLRDGLLLFLGIMAGATLALVAVALDLSRRLRAHETALLRRLGAHPALVPLMHATEAGLLLLAGALLALSLTAASDAALAGALLP
jgi:putative ABC transport system permease protein